MTLRQRNELRAMKEALGALYKVKRLVPSSMCFDEAEAQMDDYADHLGALLEKTEAAIEVLEAE